MLKTNRKSNLSLVSLLLVFTLLLGTIGPVLNFSFAAGQYVRVDAPVSGESYLVVGQAQNGDFYALTTETFSATGGDFLKGSLVTIEGDTASGSINESTMIWNFVASGNGNNIMNGNNYIRRPEQGGISLTLQSSKPTADYGDWMYNQSENRLYARSTQVSEDFSFVIRNSGQTYYFSNDGWTDDSNHSTTVSKIYLYKFEEGPAPVEVTGVSLDKDNLELEIGETATLVATVTPSDADNKNVEWSSSNTEVATVNQSGEVEAIAAGTAVILVSTDDGGKNAFANVTVKAPVVVKNGWENDRGTWYHYDNGSMTKGWLNDGGKWYFLDKATGAMKVGWLQDGGKWYYLSPSSGAMRTGWLQNNGKWYFLNTGNGSMRVGWLINNGKWYYLSLSNGSMQVEWQKINGKWYYFDKNSGQMFVNAYTPDGYYVDENGVWK